MKTLIWIRGKDLRLTDHPALAQANPGDIAVFVVDPYFFAPENAKNMPHRIQFLIDSLHALADAMHAAGGKLWAIPGRSTHVIPELAQACRVDRVIALRWVEPIGRRRDHIVQERLNVPFELLEGETLHPPGTVRTGGGTPYSVFSPFARTLRRQLTIDTPHPVPTILPSGDVPERFVGALPTLDDVGLRRNSSILRGGEAAAHERLRVFVDNKNQRYKDHRNRMDLDGTSRLSADIKFGVLSPRTVWLAVQNSSWTEADKDAYLNELIWREFNYSTLWDRPDILDNPFKAKWAGFPWRNDPDHWHAWVTGTTGYPVVDAAARQLLATGFVHNRARMITASFLTKHLQIDYRRGEAHYLKWLTDGDWAQNNMGWQWAAGSGADAQPWFRIFTPILQGRKFDPDGSYVRKWIPELAPVETKYIHSPWTAPSLALQWSGIRLGETYPLPIVDHATARQDYLTVAKRYMDQPSATNEMKYGHSRGGRNADRTSADAPLRDPRVERKCG